MGPELVLTEEQKEPDPSDRVSTKDTTVASWVNA